MGADTRKALSTIRRCIAADRVRLLPHFTERMGARGMTWPDVLAVFDAPADVRHGGADDWGRERWIVSGTAADGLAAAVVCVIGRDAAGELTVFVTLFWED